MKLRDFQYREIHKIKKNVNNVNYYVIRRRPPGAGFFANVIHVIQGIIRATEISSIPVVDMQRYFTFYSRTYSIGNTKNAWEYFYKPINNLQLDQIPKNSNLILSKGERILGNHWLSDKSQKYILEPNKIKELNSIVTKYIVLQPWCELVLVEIRKYLDWEPTQTLGVFHRFNYILLRPFNHPIQPSLVELINSVEKRIENTNINRIFVSTDNSELRKIFHKKFGGLIMREFRESEYFKDLLVKFIPNFRLHDSQLVETFGYLFETYLLSETKSAVLGISSGSVMAAILNNNQWVNPIILYHGVYGTS